MLHLLIKHVSWSKALCIAACILTLQFVLDYEINTCGAKGRYGPSQGDCITAYNNTKVKVRVLNEPGLSGVQKWTVPTEGFYT